MAMNKNIMTLLPHGFNEMVCLIKMLANGIIQGVFGTDIQMRHVLRDFYGLVFCDYDGLYLHLTDKIALL